MADLKWHFPTTIKEAAELIKDPELIAFAGGTGILLTDQHRRKDLIDFSGLPLYHSEVKKEHVELGSMLTYTDLINIFQNIDPEHIIVKSLAQSANTPLRNRITLGGSIAHFPPWTDLMGALLALESRVYLKGAYQGELSLREYLAQKELQKNNLITNVQVPLLDWDSYSYRDVRTTSDMPVFHITILIKQKKNIIQDCRIIITGNVGRFSRLKKLENYLIDRNKKDIDHEQIIEIVDVKFAGKTIDDPDYTAHLAGIQIARGIDELRGAR